MNFDTLCKFYTTNYNQIKNKKQFKQYLLYSYQILETKKAKLKLGLVTFEMKPLIVNGFVIKNSFEMVFSRQSLTSNSNKQMENILSFFQWSWDFKNITTVLIFVWTVVYHINSTIMSFYNTYIKANILDDEHLYVVLNHIFILVENRPINSSFLQHTANILTDLSLYLNLF